MKTMMKKAALGAAAFAAVAGLGVGTASAGEITGSGKNTPINPDGLPGGPLHAASECAFSGLNDDRIKGDPTEPRTQTPARVGRFVGIACNPTSGFAE